MEGSLEMFIFDFLTLFSSGRKSKQILFRIRRQQCLWLEQGQSPPSGCPLLFARFYFVMFYCFNHMESCHWHGSAHLAFREALGSTAPQATVLSLVYDQPPDFEGKSRRLMLSACLRQSLQTRRMSSSVRSYKRYYHYYHSHFPEGKPRALP